MLHSARAETNPLDKKSTSKGAVCPLSDSQAQKSIDAFGKMVPTFTQEPRCVNCHGGVDPFANPTNHGGGTVDPETDCNDCHSEMLGRGNGGPSKWQLPQPAHFFKNKDAKTLCKQMREVFQQGVDFIGHLIDDNGNSKFTEVAFHGTRALNERGRGLVDNYHDEPPQNMSHGKLIDLGFGWVDSTGGEFKGDVECGCEPQKYAVRVSYDQQIATPMFHGVKKMGPIDIPITFHDDGSFEGEQTVYINGDAVAMVCTGESTASMTLRVKGNAKEEFQNNRMHVEMESGSPMRGNATANCPRVHRTESFAGGSQSVLEKDIQGRVGDTMMWKPGVGLPGITTIIVGEIVKVKP